jgi:hypothetical protein
MLRKIALSNDPEIWALLEREFALIKAWLTTGEMDRRQDWDMKKLIYSLRRQRRRRVSRVTKRGIEKFAWAACIVASVWLTFA